MRSATNNNASGKKGRGNAPIFNVNQTADPIVNDDDYN